MAKKNDKTTKGDTAGIENIQSETTGAAVQPGTMGAPVQEGAKGKPEESEEKLPVSAGRDNGSQKDGEGNAGLDSEDKEATVGEKGGAPGDQVGDEQSPDNADVDAGAGADIDIDIDIDIDANADADINANTGAGVDVEMIIVPGKKITKEALDELPGTKVAKRKRIAIDVFGKHPECRELYFTSDLVPFFVKSDAVRHAAGALKDDKVVTVYRQ